MTSEQQAAEIARRLTIPQQRALLWLPADGSWSGKMPRSISPAVDSLCLYWRQLAQSSFNLKDPRGDQYRGARLLPQAFAVRRAIEEEAARDQQ